MKEEWKRSKEIADVAQRHVKNMRELASLKHQMELKQRQIEEDAVFLAQEFVCHESFQKDRSVESFAIFSHIK